MRFYGCVLKSRRRSGANGCRIILWLTVTIGGTIVERLVAAWGSSSVQRLV